MTATGPADDSWLDDDFRGDYAAAAASQRRLASAMRRPVVESRFIKQQRTAAAAMSEDRRAAAGSARHDRAVKELLAKQAREKEKEDFLLTMRSQKAAAEASDREAGVHRKKKRLDQLEPWERRDMLRNETLARKAKGREERSYRRAMAAQEAARAASVAEAAAKARATRRAARLAAQAEEAEGARRAAVRQADAAELEEALQATGQAHHLGWVRGLSPAARAAWGQPFVSLHVVCDGTRASTAPLARLLASLRAADYLEDEVSARVGVCVCVSRLVRARRACDQWYCVWLSGVACAWHAARVC